jgi:alkylhydroperoxidase/carboxymuconolactone decarboxylase family protein YurZ
MEADPKQKEEADRIMAAMAKRFGEVPTINRIMAERPDIFIRSAAFSKAILESPNSVLEPKMRYLLAVTAASALGSSFCIEMQGKHAKELGATRDEMMEAMLIGSYMAMTKAQSVALRGLESIYGKLEE